MKYRTLMLSTLAVVLGGCAAGTHSPLRLATGASAQTLCNAAFVSRLDPARTLRAQLHAEPGMALIDWALRYEIDVAERSVRANVLGGSHARSIFRAGRGCTLVFGTGRPPEALVAAPRQPLVLADIAGSKAVAPITPALNAAIDSAFSGYANGVPRSTQAIVVVHRGRVIGERYAPDVTVRTPLDSHSLAKSVINALVGILVRDGRLDLDRPVDVSADVKMNRANAPAPTIGELLRMTAGFGFDEGVGTSLASQIWYEEGDTAAASARSVGRSPRRDGWGYCNRCYALLSKVVGDAIGGGPQGVRDFATRELFGPLGMDDVVPEFDQAGTLMGANAIFASPRDFARFGLLYLNDGIAGGRRILPAGWVAMSTRQTPGIGYGAGFWLNATQQPMPNWPINWGLPHAPADAFFARGYLGQYIVIVPSSDLVIVRMGQSHARGGEIESVGQLTNEVVRLVGRDHATR